MDNPFANLAIDTIADTVAASESKSQYNLYLKKVNVEFIDTYAKGRGLNRSNLIDGILDAIRLASVKDDETAK